MVERRGIAAALRLAAIVDSSDDAIISKDLNGTILSWNRRAEVMFGFTAEEAVGQSITIIIPQDRRFEEAEVLRHVRAGEPVEHFETVRQRKDGTTLFISLTVSPIRDLDGSVIGASKIARDISDRKQAESLSADLQRRLLALIAASGSLLRSPRLDDVLPAILNLATELLSADGYAIWRCDDENTWRVVSSSGVSDEFTGRLVSEADRGMGSLTDPLAVEDVLTSVRLEGRREAYRLEGIQSILAVPLLIGSRNSGSLVTYYRTRHSFTDVEVQTGRALGNLAAAAITTAELYEEQHRSREAAERLNRRAAFLAEASALLAGSLDYQATLRAVANLAVPHIADWCAVDIVDDRGEIQRLAVAHVDPAKVEYARVLGEQYPQDRESPDGIHAVIRTGRAAMLAEIPDELIAARARTPEHLRIIRELGLTSYICVPLIAHGRTLGALTFVSAESGRRYDEHDLRFAEDVAYRAALAVDNAHTYRHVSAANRAKDEFLATLSHELRTPLNAVLGWARMLREGGVREERRAHALEVIERNAGAQLRLVEDLLDVSRIITGKFRLDVQQVDVSSTIEAALEAVQPAAMAKRIQLRKALDPTAGTLHGDAGRLQQMVWNLLANAVKFTPHGGFVQITLRRAVSVLEIEVSDNGEGLIPDVLPFVFDRFRQADSGPSRGHMGLGLGLAIVRHIAELHGGAVSASSPGPGQGATFRITLPVEASAVRDTGANRLYPSISQAHGGPMPAPSALLGVHVLVVENDADARELITSLLANCAADVTAVESAGEALAALDRRLPDVILSDIEMPEVDGYEFIRLVRARDRAQGGSVAAIALTAYARPEDRERLLRSGFQAHLAKPVDFNELVAAVASFGGKDAPSKRAS
jgi:PAS domain S-box-containing protein